MLESSSFILNIKNNNISINNIITGSSIKMSTILNVVIDCVEYIAQYCVDKLSIIHLNIFIIGIITILNFIFLFTKFNVIKSNRYLPWAIHITDMAYKKNMLNANIYHKLSRVYVCDNTEEVIKKYYYKMISILMVIILLINGLSIIAVKKTNVEAHLFSNQYINIPKYGERSEKVNLDVEYSDSSGEKNKTNVDIVVEPNRLSETEEDNLIMEVKEYIFKHTLGENKTYGEIRSKLNLITSYSKDRNIKIDWDLDDQGLINSSGEINYNNMDESSFSKGQDIMLVAKILYFEHEYEYQIYMTVHSPKVSKKDGIINAIKEKIKSLNGGYVKRNKLRLPDKVNNYSIRYSEEVKNNKINNWIIIMIIGLILTIIISEGMKKDLEKELDMKNQILLMYYGEIISKLRLLLCAGLNITKAWEKICIDYLRKKEDDGKSNYAYEEMVCTYRKIQSGMPSIEAFKEYGKRIGLSPYIKLSTLILQNIKTGSKGFVDALELEAKFVESMRQELFVKEGHKLGTKLLLPMIVMMGLTMVIVVIPAFMSM